MIAADLSRAPQVVVKVPHHGSRTSSSLAFVEAIQPTLAVVSAGRHNRFGHPDEAVVGRYAAHGAQVLETGVVGAVTVCSDGRAIQVVTSRPR